MYTWAQENQTHPYMDGLTHPKTQLYTYEIQHHINMFMLQCISN